MADGTSNVLDELGARQASGGRACPDCGNVTTALDCGRCGHHMGRATNQPNHRYRLIPAAEAATLPPLKWRVRGVLPATGVAILIGESGSGKTFVAHDLVHTIAEGAPTWFGRKVEQAPVVYLMLEGEGGLGQRVKAHQMHHGRAAPDQLYFVTQGFDVRKATDQDAIAEAVREAGADGGLLVLDTLNRAAPGADENSPEGMGEIIEGAKRLQDLLGGVVLIVHHTGKDKARGARGHGSLIAAVDACIEVERDRAMNTRHWKLAKAKDGRDGDLMPFDLISVQVGAYPDGEPITSCVIAPSAGQVVHQPEAEPFAVDDSDVLAAILHADAVGFRVPTAVAGARPAQKVLAELLPKYLAHKADRIKRALNRLEIRGQIFRTAVKGADRTFREYWTAKKPTEANPADGDGACNAGNAGNAVNPELPAMPSSLNSPACNAGNSLHRGVGGLSHTPITCAETVDPETGEILPVAADCTGGDHA